MTTPWLLEIGIAITLQTSLVLLLTYLLGKKLASEQGRSRLWTLAHGLILGLTLLAFFVPHLRLWHLESLVGRDIPVAWMLAGIYLARLLVGVWFCGMLVSLLLFVYRMVNTCRFLRTCVRVELDLPGCVNPQNGPDAVQPILLKSPWLTGPFCWQFHRPCIVLPEFLLNFPPGQIQSIVDHELAHLRYQHPLQLFLQRLVEIVFWFLPLTWWSSQRCNEVREFVCDTAAIRSPDEIPQYLRTLLDVIEQSQCCSPDKDPSLAFGRGQSVIRARIERLVQIAREGQPETVTRLTDRQAAGILLVATTLLFLLLWPPVNLQASSRSPFSPWPRWSAVAIQHLGIPVRDYEIYDRRLRLNEAIEHQGLRAR